MPGIMSDNDIQGQFTELVRLLQSQEWSEIWKGLGMSIETFDTLGLAPNASDRDVWQRCQLHQVLLITGNRNQEGPDSLETTIRTLNQSDSLPVFTLADATRFQHSRAYADRVVARLLDYLMYLENYRGAGRLYLP
jgi:hypothetical protein